MGQTERSAMREVLEEDAPMVLVFFVDGGPNAMENAIERTHAVVEALPPALRPTPIRMPGSENEILPMHVTLNHDPGCKSQNSYRMQDCTCESLTAHAVPLTPAQVAALEATGEFDAVRDYEGGVIKTPSEHEPE